MGNKNFINIIMIPKIIHYCWLSNDPFPEVIQNCINSWKKILPDYEFVKWDTKRFDINSVPYVKEAFKQKKYAFCADYIRVYALYTMGGIYLDSDVMLYKSFDPFLSYKSFSSLEYHYYFTYAHVKNKKERLVGIEAAVLGSEKGEQWTKDVMDYLETQSFSNKKKNLEKNIMPRVIARILKEKYGFKYFPVFQQLENGFMIFPPEVFSSNSSCITPIKYSSHLGANSWGYISKGYCLQIIKKFLVDIHLMSLVNKIRGIEKFK